MKYYGKYNTQTEKSLFPRLLLMATVGGKTLAALDLNKYRYSCVSNIQLKSSQFLAVIWK